jgi:hypothetical protein
VIRMAVMRVSSWMNCLFFTSRYRYRIPAACPHSVPARTFSCSAE